MATRESNKQAHPGKAIKAKKHWTKEEVQQECKAKEQAKAAQWEVNEWIIHHKAEFEHATLANKDIINATPHPPFTPMQQPAFHNHQNTYLFLVGETSKVDGSNEDTALFLGLENSDKASVMEEDQHPESDSPSQPVEKWKT